MELRSGLDAAPAGRRVPPPSATTLYEREVSLAQMWLLRGMQALNTLKEWKKAGDMDLWDLSGMPVEATYRGWVFDRLLESTLDYIVTDARIVARCVGADSVSLGESTFPTERKALIASFRITGIDDWNIQERSLRRRPGRSLKAWALVDPAAFATRVRASLAQRRRASPEPQ